MDIQEVIKLVSIQFPTKIELEVLNEKINSFRYVYRNSRGNGRAYIIISEIDATIIITLFKSDREPEDLYTDYLRFGIDFFPDNLKEIECILKLINV